MNLIHDTKYTSSAQKEMYDQAATYVGKSDLVSRIHELNVPYVDEVRNHIETTNKINNDWVTRFLQTAQKIVSFVAENLIPFMAWSVIFLSFMAIFTDPSQTFSLLSVIKGIGFGTGLLYLGPILPSRCQKYVRWMENQWISSHFHDNDPTIRNLKSWYGVFKDQEEERLHVYHLIVFSLIVGKVELKREIVNLIKKINDFNNIKKEIESPKNPGRDIFVAFLKA